MKRFLLAAVALSALTSAAALAADLPARQMYTKAPAMAGYNWTGAYIGLNIGGAFGDFSSPVTGSNSMSGVTGGAQIGYNWQAPGTPWVWGVEADADASFIKGSTSVTCAPGGCETRNRWLATGRGRIGYAWDRFLPYLTGGVAFGDLKMTNPLGATATKTKVGYTLGGGVEYAFLGNWSAKIEYLYADLGKASCPAATCGSVVPGHDADIKFRAHLAKVGVNYRF